MHYNIIIIDVSAQVTFKLTLSKLHYKRCEKEEYNRKKHTEDYVLNPSIGFRESGSFVCVHLHVSSNIYIVWFFNKMYIIICRQYNACLLKFRTVIHYKTDMFIMVQHVCL